MTTLLPPVHTDSFRWTTRRVVVAVLATVGYALLVAIPTDLVDTPLFGREIPPTWWSWPVLLVTSLLAGLLTATYVAAGETSDADPPAGADRPAQGGYLAGFLTFFAVGCPVCNKLVLLALGTSGALAWFEPVQPLLSVAAVGVLAWALRVRLRNQAACRVPA
jgi:hypothetical protein